MQGRADEIQEELQQIKDRFDKYMSKYPSRFSEKPAISRLAVEQKSPVYLTY